MSIDVGAMTGVRDNPLRSRVDVTHGYPPRRPTSWASAWVTAAGSHPLRGLRSDQPVRGRVRSTPKTTSLPPSGVSSPAEIDRPVLLTRTKQPGLGRAGAGTAEFEDPAYIALGATPR